MAARPLALSHRALGPFALGDSLHHTLAFLRSPAGAQSFARVNVAFDPQTPATTPVVLTLLPGTVDLALVFASPSQRLAEVHLPLAPPAPGDAGSSPSSAPSPVTLTYGTHTLVGPQHVSLTKRDVERVLGPTFAPSPSVAQPPATAKADEVWYPGLGFAFGRAGTCERVWVCERGLELELAGERAGGEGEVVQGVVDLPSSSLTLHFAPSPSSPSPPTPLTLTPGQTTAADLLAALGAPEAVMDRTDSRLGIHRGGGGTEVEGDEEEAGYFHNYFSLGLDVLLSPLGGTHVVRKLVLHSNLPGTVGWGRYDRCPWAVPTPGGGEVDVRTPVERLLRALAPGDAGGEDARKTQGKDKPKHGVLAHVSYPLPSSSTTSPSLSPTSPAAEPARGLFAHANALARSMPLSRTLDGAPGAGVRLDAFAAPGGAGGEGRLIALGEGCVLECGQGGWVEGLVLF